MRGAPARGFTLVEVLVALIVVALGLGALMVAVTGTADISRRLRDKTLAQWIALNHLSELRLSGSKSGLAVSTQSSLSPQSSDAVEIKFANRTWHYDTRYFDTSFQSMKRIVVRVYAGDAKTKGNPLAEATSFMGTALSTAGSSNNADWTSVAATTQAGAGVPVSGSGGTAGAPVPTRNAPGVPRPGLNPVPIGSTPTPPVEP